MSDVNAQRAEEHIAQAEARLRMVETGDNGYVTVEILATELEERDPALWTGRTVAAMIRDAVRLGTDHGEARSDE